MVNDESAVLPVDVGFDSDEGTALSLAVEVDSLSRARSSRPCHDDGWIDDNHYFQSDKPADAYVANEWKEVCKDFDEIQVNGGTRCGCEQGNHC